MNKHDRQIALHELSGPLSLTRLGMLAEQAVRGFWPLWSVLLALFVVLAFGIHTSLSLEAFWIGSAAFVAGIGYGIWHVWRQFRWVSEADAIDRLDRSMPGRPLTATFDDMAIGGDDEASRTVWQAHILRTKKRLAEARAVEPDLTLSDRDPYALRYAALLAFGVAVMFGSIWRLGAPEISLPGTPGEAVIAGPSWEAWVEPPAYTGKPTIYMNDVRADSLTVPVGSQITMRLYGQVGSIAWSETLSGEAAPEEAQSAFSIDVAQSGSLSVADRVWEITARADARPKVWFQGAIERALNGEMKMPFNASDDYGVEMGTTTITLDLAGVDRRHGLAVEPEPRDAVVLDLPMPISGDRDNFSDLLIENLSEHPWAGLNVRFSLDVLDAAGQDSDDEFVNTTLPGRRFFQPIAAAVVEQRRDLLWSRENGKRVSQILRTISYKPDGYFPNETAYLMIQRALTQLELHTRYGLSPEIQNQIAELLWRAAVRLEEGRLADALARLREAQERLNQAMQDGASDEEISELMQELSEAMRQYMEQLAQNPEEGGEQQQGQNGEGQEITQDQLQEMLDEIERLMKEGRTAEAEQLLQELMEMMENMQVTEGQQGEGQQSPGDQAMEGLGETLREQQGLSDEAFRDLQEQFNPGAQAGESQGNQGRNGGQGQGESHEGGNGQGQAQNQGENGEQQEGEGQSGAGEREEQGQGSLADRQQRLRDELARQRGRPLPGEGTEAGDAAREALERADDAMGRAEEALRNDQTAEALGAQSDAMEALREGMRNLGEAMAQNEQQGQQGNSDGQFSEQNRDPLGREQGDSGRVGTDEGLLGNELAQRRSRELLDEIRRRSGEQQRPEVERDYLKRLLDQF